MGAAGLRGFRGACFLRARAQVLRPGTAVEVGEEDGGRGLGESGSEEARDVTVEKTGVNEEALGTPESGAQWGSSYRLVASEKWKRKSAAMGRPLTEALVEYAQPLEGMKVLDLASGTGEPAISIAERVGPTGQVSALDLSSDLLAIAARRAQQRGLTNISFHRGDAQALPFPDNGFDLAACRFGVMFFNDVARALGELRRV